MSDTYLIDEEKIEKAILVGVNTGEDPFMEQSMVELEALANACDMECVFDMVQNMENMNKATCLGSGKVNELKVLINDLEADCVIFDNTLTPMQMKNLQDELGCIVMDRTGLILEIFSKRASSREAKLQVESAQLKYMLPRLAGMRTNLGRQGGGSGSRSNKGAGEKKIELDRRAIERRITVLRRELDELSTNKSTQRKRRMNQPIKTAALVGYTNAGKSTILNRLLEKYGEKSEKTVFEKNMLFATLDTSVRRMSRKDHQDFFLSDTVGFIHKLPHGLVEAFKSTLDESLQADLLIHVVDFSDEDFKHHIEVSNDTLGEIGAGGIPVLYVYNKCDLKSGSNYSDSEDSIYISAYNSLDIERLCNKIEKLLYKDRKNVTFLFPYSLGGTVNSFKEDGHIISLDYTDEGIKLNCLCSEADFNRYEEFVLKNSM